MTVATEALPDVEGATLSKGSIAAWTRYTDMKRQAERTNGNAPEAPELIVVVRVSRADIAKFHETPWVELKAMARRGERGLALIAVTGVERASGDEAWMGDCKSRGMLKGRSCLYSQGWSA